MIQKKKLCSSCGELNIIWKNEDQIKNFRLDLEQLNTQFNVVTIEINNSNDNKSKTKRNFMSHCPITEGSTFREEHESIAAAELSRDIFYSSEVIGSHLVYGINIKSAEHMVKLFDGFMKLLTGFIKRYVNDGNFCFFAEDTEIFSKNLFTNSVKSYTREDGNDLNEFLDKVFLVMNQEERKSYPTYLQDFPYVNGGLFAKSSSIRG